MQKQTIAVCGATGSQGRAVVASLIAAGRWDVVALSRTPGGAEAQALQRAGARLVHADLLDEASLEAAFRGAYGVFGVTQPWSPDYKSCDVAGEVRQGRNIVDAVRATSVQHLVLSTVLTFGPGRIGVPHVDSKIDIEHYARSQRVPLTLLRPGSFMDNIGRPFFPVKRGRIRGLAAGDAKVPYVACADIGVLAAVAFERRDEFLGKDVPAVGELASGDEIAAALSRLRNGEPFKYTAPPAFLLWLFAREFYTMRRAFEANGRPPLSQDLLDAVDATRRLNPAVTTIAKHLDRQGFGTKTLG